VSSLFHSPIRHRFYQHPLVNTVKRKMSVGKVGGELTGEVISQKSVAGPRIQNIDFQNLNNASTTTTLLLLFLHWPFLCNCHSVILNASFHTICIAYFLQCNSREILSSLSAGTLICCAMNLFRILLKSRSFESSAGESKLSRSLK
jgi:hypothetical protein